MSPVICKGVCQQDGPVQLSTEGAACPVGQQRVPLPGLSEVTRAASARGGDLLVSQTLLLLVKIRAGPAALVPASP